MELHHVAVLITIVLLGMIVAISCLLLLRRMSLARMERREREFVDKYREDVVELVMEPDALPSRALLTANDVESRSAIATLLVTYSRMVRGEASDRIRSFVLNGGYVDAAIRDLGSRQAWRRGRAAHTLGCFGSSRAVQHLSLTMIRDPSESVRITAARALGGIDDYKAAAALLMVLPTDRVPKGVIAHSLHRLGARAHRALIDACSDDAVEIRRVAVQLVGLFGDGFDLEAQRLVRSILCKRLAHDPDAAVRIAACRSLGAVGDAEVVPGLLDALDDSEPAVIEAACDAAAQLRVREVVPALRLLLDPGSDEQRSPQTRRAAARALAVLTPRGDDAGLADSPYLIEARDIERVRSVAS